MLLNGCSIRPAIVHLRCSSISYTSTTATLSFYHTTHFYTMASSATPAALRNRKNNNTTASSSPSRAHSSHSGHSHSGGGGHSHTHGGAEEADALLAALRGSSDPGSRITLIGLGANVGLTGVKGVAGWFLGSAALLADAAHSGSDLLADIVTLTTYRMSRKPVSENYPYGYGSESRVSPVGDCVGQQELTSTHFSRRIRITGISRSLFPLDWNRPWHWCVFAFQSPPPPSLPASFFLLN